MYLDCELRYSPLNKIVYDFAHDQWFNVISELEWTLDEDEIKSKSSTSGKESTKNELYGELISIFNKANRDLHEQERKDSRGCFPSYQK